MIVFRSPAHYLCSALKKTLLSNISLYRYWSNFKEISLDLSLFLLTLKHRARFFSLPRSRSRSRVGAETRAESEQRGSIRRRRENLSSKAVTLKHFKSNQLISRWSGNRTEIENSQNLIKTTSKVRLLSILIRRDKEKQSRLSVDAIKSWESKIRSMS